ncbi:ABC transporter I family member 11, chloroplastic isoform X2 [Capsicum chacoense]|uniref:ABC transporter I family member 11, chloroplastic isoform X2 n=1 Tax=Capsicum annuum TaxID=4072 RepID=UPI001FB12F75|nr:ABC transporter I family member 11, chloroplastic isoform X2 [Capsicum annuum]
MGSVPLSSSSLLNFRSYSSSIFGRPSSTFSCPHRRFRKAQTLSVSCDYSSFERLLNIFWLYSGGGNNRCGTFFFFMGLEIRDVSYRPPGTKIDLLSQVSFSIPEKSFGLIFGRSGSGKTTLLQLIAGLSQPTTGSIYVQRYSDDGEKIKSPEPLQPERVGIVFQFPERYFVADTVLDEVTFGWPRQKGGLQLRELLASRLQKAITSVGLTGISLDKDPHSLSGGYKRRLALAIQLVQTPDLLILDEPLAGLDWKARADVVKLLKHLKEELTLLVVSHDLKELASLVDQSWRMEMGGALKREPLPI